MKSPPFWVAWMPRSDFPRLGVGLRHLRNNHTRMKRYGRIHNNKTKNMAFLNYKTNR
jgi:hypothetical protein